MSQIFGILGSVLCHFCLLGAEEKVCCTCGCSYIQYWYGNTVVSRIVLLASIHTIALEVFEGWGNNGEEQLSDYV